MAPPLANAARAFVAITVVALLADALLGFIISGLGALGGPPGAPWWVSGHVPERSRWVVFALLLVAVARSPLLAAVVTPLPAATAWRAAGRLAILVPLLWIVALWLVQATLFTVAGRWDIDGRTFLEPDYYRRLFAGYTPWLLGGAAALVASRHVE